jgi:hypothetical protein
MLRKLGSPKIRLICCPLAEMIGLLFCGVLLGGRSKVSSRYKVMYKLMEKKYNMIIKVIKLQKISVSQERERRSKLQQARMIMGSLEWRRMKVISLWLLSLGLERLNSQQLQIIIRGKGKRRRWNLFFNMLMDIGAKIAEVILFMWNRIKLHIILLVWGLSWI